MNVHSYLKKVVLDLCKMSVEIIKYKFLVCDHAYFSCETNIARLVRAKVEK